MNAPNFSFDPDKLPLVAGNGQALATPAREAYPVTAGDDFSGANEEAGDYRKLFFMVLGLSLKYRWLIAAICSAAIAIGFLVTFMSTPVYRATTVIQIDRMAPRVVKLDHSDSDARYIGGPDRFFETQYDLLKSRSLAERVAANLDLGAKPDFLSPSSPSGWANFRNMIFPRAKAVDNRTLEQRKTAAARMIMGGLSVDPVTNSLLVKISYDSPDPSWAQQIANGIADTYISVNLERRYGATAYARNFLKERLDELKLKLEESEKALVAYADKKEIITTSDGQHSLADTDLKALNEALQKTTMSRIHLQEEWEQATGTTGLGLPQVLLDPSIQALRTQRATLLAQYQEKLGTFKPAYPDMVRLKSQIDQIDHILKEAVITIKQSLKAKYEAALQEEESLRKKIGEAKSTVINTRNKEIEYNILKREADTNRTLYQGLLQQYKDVGVAGAVDTNNVAIIDRAQLPGSPFTPVLRKNLLISFVLGLLATALTIAVLEILDDTFKSPEEVEEQLGLAVLGIIPLATSDVVTDIKDSPNSPLAEAYRSFRTALQFSTDQGAPKSILVTSARPGEGKSTTALALAINFAQLGTKVLLIDADLRNPSQHRNLKVENKAGLANYLAGGGGSGGIFQQTQIPGLYFMASGPLPPNPAELLAGPKMLSLLSAASENFDTIVIDSPPIMGLADSPLLASIAGGTLLVMATADTRRGVIRAALKRLHFARARMVGAVMNKFDFRTASYGYGYGYGYGAIEHYGYGQNAHAQVEHSPKE